MEKTNTAGKKYKWIRKLIYVVLALLVFVSAYSVVYFFFYYLSPTQIIRRALENSLTSGTLDYVGELTGEFMFNEQMDSVDEFSNLDLLSKTFSSYKFDLKGFYKPSDRNGYLDITLSSDGNGFGEAEVISVDGLFFKITKIEATNIFDNKDLIGKWFVLGSGVMQEPKGETESDTSRYYNQPFLVFQENLPYDFISGEESYHYKVGVDKDDLEKLFTQNIREEETRKFLSNSVKSIEFTDTDIWIGKKDGLVKKIRTYAMINNVGTEGNNLKLKLELTLSYGNQGEVVEPPEDFIDFREAFDN